MEESQKAEWGTQFRNIGYNHDILGSEKPFCFIFELKFSCYFYFFACLKEFNLII